MPLTREQAQARLTELLKDPKGEGSDELFDLLGSDAVSSEHLSQALKHEDPAVRTLALDAKELESHHVLRGLKDPEAIVRRKAALRLDNVEDLTPILDSASDPDRFVRNEALKHLVLAKHPGLTSDHLKEALRHPDRIASEAALRHPNLSEENISQVLSESNRPYEKVLAVSHKNATSKNLLEAIKGPDNVDSSHVIETVLNHPNSTHEHVGEALNNESSWVRASAAKHPKATEEQISQALRDPDVHVRTNAITNPNATREQLTRVLSNPKEDAVVARYAAYHPNASSEHISQALRHEEADVRRAAMENPNVTSSHILQALSDKHPGLTDVRRNAIRHPNFGPEHVEVALQDSDLDNVTRVLGSKYIRPEHISRFLKNPSGRTWDIQHAVEAIRNPNANAQNIHEALSHPSGAVRENAANRKDLTVEHIERALKDVDSGVRSAAIRHPKATQEQISQALNDADEDVASAALSNPGLTSQHIGNALTLKSSRIREIAARHPKATQEQISQALSDTSSSVRWAAVANPNITDENIKQALDDQNPDVRERAAKRAELVFPDQLHDESVIYQPNTEHFRQYRRAVEQHGAPVHKKDFAAHGIKYEHVARLLNHKGELTQEKLSEHIEAQPKHKFNVSHDVWEGSQRHNEDVSQTVFQLNLTNEHINKMKNAGVYDTFRQIHEASRASGHPTRPSTVGWVRYNASSGDSKRPLGLHIDEIQSDLGRSIVKQAAVQAKAAKAAGEITEEQANEAVKRANQKYPDSHLETIKHILFGEYQPERVIHEAFHQHMRDQGMTGGEIHINSPELKGKLAGMQEREPLPVHIKQTYEETPKKLGYKPNEYGRLNVQDTIAHQGDKTFSTVLAKMRKLKEEISLKKAVADDFVEMFRKYGEHPNDCETGADPDQILRDKKKKRAKQMEEQEKFKKSDEIGEAIPVSSSVVLKSPSLSEEYATVLKSGFVSADGDNIGSTVEQSVLANDVEGIRKQSELIRAGQDYLKEVMTAMGAEVIVSGGDDNLFKFTHFPTLSQLEEIRKEYQKRTGYTITMGIAPEMREAVKALVYGKLTGKNCLKRWSPEMEEELHALAHPQKEEDKMREHGMLKSMAVTPEQYDDPHDNMEVLLEEHRRLVARLKAADPELLDDELKIQSEELEAMKASQDMSPKRKAELLEEHERLVDALATKDPEKIMKEREIQERELEELEMEEEGELVEMDPNEVMRASTPRWRD